MDGINFVFISKDYSVAYDKGRIKMFTQECHSLPFLYKAVLHCKIFPACNCFLTEQFCIIKIIPAFLLHSPFSHEYFEKIKPYISIQATVISVSDIQGFLTEGHKGKYYVTYCIHCSQIFTMLPNKHFNSG
jgi:hypothetical protein